MPSISHHHSVKRRCWLLSWTLLGTVVYLFVGGLVMRALERPVEEDLLKDQDDEVQLLRTELNLSDWHINRLEEVGACDFSRSGAPHWTLTGSCFYALTVITTIGYGSFAPRTHNGRSFTAFFALIGIGVVGQILAQSSTLLEGIALGLLARARGRRKAKEKGSSERDDSSDPPSSPTSAAAPVGAAQRWELIFSHFVKSDEPITPSALQDMLCELSESGSVDKELLNHVIEEVAPDGGTITPAALTRAVALWFRLESALPPGVGRLYVGCLLSVTTAWVLIWSAAFSAVEGWTYRESMWFCFVTMTTIGFGDFTPDSMAGRALSFLFIVPGLGLGAMVLGAVWDAFDARRFWWLQRAHRRGLVSEKMLEAHGVAFSIRNPDKQRRRRPKAWRTARREQRFFRDLGVRSPVTGPLEVPDCLATVSTLPVTAGVADPRKAEAEAAEKEKERSDKIRSPPLAAVSGSDRLRQPLLLLDGVPRMNTEELPPKPPLPRSSTAPRRLSRAEMEAAEESVQDVSNSFTQGVRPSQTHAGFPTRGSPRLANRVPQHLRSYRLQPRPPDPPPGLSLVRVEPATLRSGSSNPSVSGADTLSFSGSRRLTSPFVDPSGAVLSLLSPTDSDRAGRSPRGPGRGTPPL